MTNITLSNKSRMNRYLFGEKYNIGELVDRALAEWDRLENSVLKKYVDVSAQLNVVKKQQEKQQRG